MEISILALPLIASIISGFFGRFIGDRSSEIITSLLVSISAIFSCLVFYEVIVNQYQENIIIATWISSGSLEVNWSMNIDALSSVMLVVVIKCQEQGDTPAITLILRSSFIPNSEKKEMVELTKEEFAVDKELDERWCKYFI